MRIPPFASLILLPLIGLSGCKTSPKFSERLWWSPLTIPEFESRYEYDAKGYPILPKVTYGPESAATAERQRLIRLLEQNNQLLERIADE
jgi:hypothetical protein